MSLLIILLTGCQSTKTVTLHDYQTIVKPPPAAYLTECSLPFSASPKTYGEAVIRDEAWLTAFKLCACKIEQNRTYYGYKNQNNTCQDEEKEKKAQ